MEILYYLSYNPAISALVGAIVGSLLTILSFRIIKRYEKEYEREDAGLIALERLERKITLHKYDIQCFINEFANKEALLEYKRVNRERRKIINLVEEIYHMLPLVPFLSMKEEIKYFIAVSNKAYEGVFQFVYNDKNGKNIFLEAYKEMNSEHVNILKKIDAFLISKNRRLPHKQEETKE